MEESALSAGLHGFKCYNCHHNNPFIDRPSVIICEIESPGDPPETRTYTCRACSRSNEVTMGKSAWERLAALQKKHGV
jgi:hypothetical protein